MPETLPCAYAMRHSAVSCLGRTRPKAAIPTTVETMTMTPDLPSAQAAASAEAVPSIIDSFVARNRSYAAA